MALTQIRKNLLIDFGEIVQARYRERDFPMDESEKVYIHIVYRNGFQEDIAFSLEEGRALWDRIKKETMDV